MYTADTSRYASMVYRRCGKSGLKLPAISLGLWHNFGGIDNFDNSQQMLLGAFDMGITHFDLANNYGPPAGSAEETFGRVMDKQLRAYRDEIIVSTKAGYGMWEGPYGDWGSKKYLVASLDQSLRRMKLDYVDIFYHHRPDPETPIEETMAALDLIVRQGKALYVGISNYNAEQTSRAIAELQRLGTPCLIHQTKYSMFDRTPENGLLDVLGSKGVGCIAFSPLAQGLLTDRYLNGIPSDSRAAKPHGFLKASDITSQTVSTIQKLNAIARERNQSLAQMAVAWLLKDDRMTSIIAGASRLQQLENTADSLKNMRFDKSELEEIEKVLSEREI